MVLLASVFFFVPESSDSKLPAGLFDASKKPYVSYERHQQSSLSLLHILWCFDLPLQNVCVAAWHLVQATSRCCLAALINALHGSVVSFSADTTITTEANDACDVGPMSATAFWHTLFRRERHAQLQARQRERPKDMQNHAFRSRIY